MSSSSSLAPSGVGGRAAGARRTGKNAALLAGVWVVCFAFLLLLFRNAGDRCYPDGDALPLVVTSTSYVAPPRPSEWFSSGFSRYFRPFPEWNARGVTYLRPMYQFCCFANYLLWQDHWERHVYFNYLLLAFGATLAFYLAHEVLGCSVGWALLAAVSVLFNPAASYVVSGPIGVFDMLAAILGCFALLLLLKRRWYTATAMLIVAVFTKETALPMTLAAFVTCCLIEWRAGGVPFLRSLARASLLLLPIAVWVLSRRLAFGSLLGGVPKIGSFQAKDILWNVALFPLNWPLGLADGPLDPLTTVRAFFLHQPEQISYSGVVVLAANLLILLWGILAAARLLYKRKPIAFDSPAVIFLLWLAAIFCYLVVLRLKPRFGCLFYLLGISLLVRALAETIGRRQFTRSAGLAAILILLAISPVLEMASCVLASEERRRTPSPQTVVETIHRAGNQFDAVYVLNDMTGRRGGAFLGAFARSKSPVIILNCLSGEFPSPPSQDSNADEGAAVKIRGAPQGSTAIEVRLGPSLCFCFPDTSPELMFPEPGSRVLRRNKDLTYEFPELKSYKGLTGGSGIDFGSRMLIRISDPRRYGIVYFDDKTGTEKIVAKGESIP
jgi:hypothetical protein